MDLFFGTSGPRDAKIALVGEAWGHNEEIARLPFVGQSGALLDDLLESVNLFRNEIFCTNVLSHRPPNNEMWKMFYPQKEVKKWVSFNGLFPREIVVKHYLRLQEQIRVVNPDIIIAAGNYALWALCPDVMRFSTANGVRVPAGIVSYRGSQLRASEEFDRRRVVPIVHPTAALRDWQQTYFIRHDLKTRVNKWQEPIYDLTIRPDFSTVMYWLDAIEADLRRGPARVAVDIETYKHHISCIGLAVSPRSAISIPLMCIERDHYWTLAEEQEIVIRLRHILQHENFLLLGQNFTYDAQYLYLYWMLKPRIHLDTLVAHHLLYPGTRGALGQLSSLYCEFHRFWKDDGKTWVEDEDEGRQWRYNALDCCVTWEVASVLENLLKRENMWHLYEEERRETQITLLEMMYRGILRDENTRSEIQKNLLEQSTLLQERLEYILPESVWPRLKKASPWYSSPKQLMAILYEELGLPEQRNRKTKRPSTDDDALKAIAKKEPILRPIIEMILSLRSLGVYNANFVEAKADPDGRVRCSFALTGTETFRLSSSKSAFDTGGNMQNLPIGDE